MFRFSSVFLSIWSIFIIAVLISLSANSVIPVAASLHGHCVYYVVECLDFVVFQSRIMAFVLAGIKVICGLG